MGCPKIQAIYYKSENTFWQRYSAFLANHDQNKDQKWKQKFESLSKDLKSALIAC